MKKAFTLKHFVNQGFTLIELLVVIGVLAVIAAGVVALINPRDKISQANDSKVQSDIGQLATGTVSYAAQQTNGSYAATSAILQTSGELQAIPVQPVTGAAYTYTAAPAGCGPAPAAPCTTVAIRGVLRSAKYTATPEWRWCSSTGQASAVATGAVCP